LTYTLRDNGKIDNFREIAATTGQPLGEATPPSGNPVANGRHAFQRKTIAGGARNLPAIKTWLDRKEKPHGD
jgi:hypothetical protein